MDQATVLAAPMPFEFEGKTYLVAERSFDQEKQFQRYLEHKELAGIRRNAEALGAVDYDRALDRWQKGVGAGVYEWGAEYAWKAVNTPSGIKYLYALAVMEGTPKLLEHQALELMDRVFEDDVAWKALQKIVGALNDPNRKRRAKEAEPASTPVPASVAPESPSPA